MPSTLDPRLAVAMKPLGEHDVIRSSNVLVSASIPLRSDTELLLDLMVSIIDNSIRMTCAVLVTDLLSEINCS